MAGKKTKSSGQRAICPGCVNDPRRLDSNPAKGIDDTLRLESGTGTYFCAQGHTYTIEQLREALEAAKNPQETAAADRPENGGFEVPGSEGILAPETGENGAILEGSVDEVDDNPEKADAGFTVHEIGQQYPVSEAVLAHFRENERVLAEDGSSHSVDDLHSGHVAALLPNGDMLVQIVLPENMVGPVTELAQQDRKTVDQWVSENFLFYIESFFTAPRA